MRLSYYQWILCLLRTNAGLSTTACVPFQVARPDPDHTSLLLSEGFSQLLEYREPVSVVAVVGPYHSGKSFLLNALLDEGDLNAFAVGSKTTPETRGIWLCRTGLRDADGVEVWLMDTEGFFGPNTSEAYDAQLFSVASMLSAHLLYNTIKTIDQQAVSLLDTLARQAHFFRARMNVESPSLAKRWNFPPLTWIVEDFAQDASGDGQNEDATGWLKSFLPADNMTGSSQGVYKDVPSFFSKMYRELHAKTLFLPATQMKQLQDLSRLHSDELSGEFQDDLRKLREHILRSTQAQHNMQGRPMTGESLAHCLKSIIEAFRSGRFPELPPIWDNWSMQVRKMALAEAEAAFHASLAQNNTAISGTFVQEGHDMPPSLQEFSEALDGAWTHALAFHEELLHDFGGAAGHVAELQSLLEVHFERFTNSYKVRIRHWVSALLMNHTVSVKAKLKSYAFPMSEDELAQVANALREDAIDSFSCSWKTISKAGPPSRSGLTVQMPSYATLPQEHLAAELETVVHAVKNDNQARINLILQSALSDVVPSIRQYVKLLLESLPLDVADLNQRQGALTQVMVARLEEKSLAIKLGLRDSDSFAQNKNRVHEIVQEEFTRLSSENAEILKVLAAEVRRCASSKILTNGNGKYYQYLFGWLHHIRILNRWYWDHIQECFIKASPAKHIPATVQQKIFSDWYNEDVVPTVKPLRFPVSGLWLCLVLFPILCIGLLRWVLKRTFDSGRAPKDMSEDEFIEFVRGEGNPTTAALDTARTMGETSPRDVQKSQLEGVSRSNNSAILQDVPSDVVLSTAESMGISCPDISSPQLIEQTKPAVTNSVQSTKVGLRRKKEAKKEETEEGQERKNNLPAAKTLATGDTNQAFPKDMAVAEAKIQSRLLAAGFGVPSVQEESAAQGVTEKKSAAQGEKDDPKKRPGYASGMKPSSFNQALQTRRAVVDADGDFFESGACEKTQSKADAGIGDSAASDVKTRPRPLAKRGDNLTDILNARRTANGESMDHDADSIHSSDDIWIGSSVPVSPQLPVGLLFPNQGSEHMGMLPSDLSSEPVAGLLSRANAILGYDLASLCVNGPEEKLRQIQYAQPAVFVTSILAAERLRKDKPEAFDKCIAVAGLGVGEYVALTVAGSLSFDNALSLVKLRGSVMQAAVGDTSSSKILNLIISGLELKEVEDLCSKVQQRFDDPRACQVTSVLAPTSITCAGSQNGVACLRGLAESSSPTNGIQKVVNCNFISGCEDKFQTALMADARSQLEIALGEAVRKMRPPRCAVYFNSTGTCMPAGTSPLHIVKVLGEQLTKPVLWAPLVQQMMQDHIEEFYTVGPGTQLKSTMPQIDRSLLRRTKWIKP